MALTEADRKKLDAIKTDPAGEFGAGGRLQAMLRFGQPDHAERQEITAALTQVEGGTDGS